MPHQIAALSLPLLLAEDGASPLYQQVYEQLRNAILAGNIAPGTRLPATRAIARELAISRNTVVSAFDQLLAEGYIESRVGDGSYVSRALPDDLLRAQAPAQVSVPPTFGRSASQRGSLLATTPVNRQRAAIATNAFRPGLPALELFPFETWARIAAASWRTADPALLGYSDPQGYSPLREAIAAYLGASRGVHCTAEEVIITSGSQQGLDLAVRVLLDPGDQVWFEDPGYIGARGACLAAGAQIVPVPIDDAGLDVDAGIARAPHARLAYITPSHQYPTGVTMSLARRLALIEWARSNGAWLVEDDYDSEFRYTGRPLPALQGLDTNRRTIYIGTFSKVLLPALRLGYLVVPRHLVTTFANARALADRSSPAIDQAILAEFIRAGHFARHIRRMRKVYAERQSVLLAAAERFLRGRIELAPAETGMHLIGWLPPGADDETIAERAARYGVVVSPLTHYAIEPLPRPGLMLGYAAVSPEAITDAVRRLAEAWK